jgi:pectinesterase
MQQPSLISSPFFIRSIVSVFAIGLAVARGASSGLAPLPIPPDLVVAADGSGNFKTIQAALESIPRDSHERQIIFVKDGLYPEKIRVDAPWITLRGESRTGTRIEFAQGANEFRTKRDNLGQAVVNLSASANDCVLENLTVKNTHGVIGVHAFAIFGAADRTVITDCDVLSQGNDTLSLWRTGGRDAIANPATGVQTDGRYYQARLNVCGSVDFICPRGWCYMADSTITEVNPKAEASIWHDGSRNQEMKFVLRNCQFTGVENFAFMRWHHDAQFYLVACTFSKAMRDQPPYHVVYPLNGGKPTPEDVKKNADLAPSNIWGTRVYYSNSHREGGDYAWIKENLAEAPGSPKSAQLTAAWTFGGTWDPERTTGPRVTHVAAKENQIEVTFNELVTVKSLPKLTLRGGGSADYTSGSGSNTLHFTLPAGKNVEGVKLDLSAGKIIASEASANLLVAETALP